MSQIYFCIPEILKRTFQTGFEHKITFLICVLVLWIYKLFKKLVERCVLKRSGIKKYYYILYFSAGNPLLRLRVVKACSLLELCVQNRYFIIDQQIARHFLQYSECLLNHPSLLWNSKWLTHFLYSRITIKGRDFSKSWNNHTP